MTVSAEIKFTQGATVGPDGQALFGSVGSAVHASNVSDASVVSWTWTIVDVPPGSAVPVGLISDGPTPSLTFTPDVTGGYLVQLDVFDSAGRSSTDLRVFGVKELSGRFVPPFKARAAALNFAGQARGWAPYAETYLRAVDKRASRVVTTSGAITAADEQVVAGSLSAPITLTLPASPVLGRRLLVADGLGGAQSHNITVSGGANTINGQSTIVLLSNFASVELQWTGTTWSILNFSSGATTPASGGWVTDYDSDWSQLPTSVVSGNGNFAIDGKTWTVANFANAGTFQITNGQGLVIQCNATNSDWNPPTTDTLPKVSLPLSALMPVMDPTWNLRISARLATTCVNDFESSVFTYGFASLFQQDFYALKGARSGNPFLQFGASFAGNNQSNVNDSTNYSDDAFEIVVGSMFSERAEFYSGAYASTWPTPMTNTRMRMISRQTTSASHQPAMTTTADPQIMLGVKSTNTLAAAKVVIQRLRVEHRG